MSAVLAARERERLRQMELEAQRTAEQLAMLEAHLEAARADAEKAEVTARWKVSAANERARLAEARAAALEEALATTAMPARPRYALADAEDAPRDRDPHGAVALMGTSLSSPLSSPRGARRGDSAADLVAAVTPPGDARAGREVSASSSSEGAAAAFAELVTWRRPGKSAKVFFGGLYAQLCVSSLRAMPLPFGTAACYGFIFALAFSLLWRLARGLRLVLWGGARFSSEDGLGGKRSDDGDETILTRRETRERDARRFAAKFGGWIAASAARRAPAVAMAWLFCERTFLWEHPPTTLKACVALWLCSLVARVWRAPLDATIFAAWFLTFAAPPALAAFGPVLETASKAVVDDARVRFAYLLDDRRVQLAGLCVAWSAAGLAGRTLIGLAAATLFLTGGERANLNARDDFGRARGNGGVTITELPSSPETGVASVAREAAAARSPATARSPRRKPTTPERLAAAERRPSLISAARPARAARDAFPSVVAHKRDPRAFAEPFPSSSPSTSEDSPSPPRARALKNETDEPKKKAVDPTRRVISVTERTTVTTRRYGAAAGVTNASEARQRMIAERTRRILDDE